MSSLIIRLSEVANLSVLTSEERAESDERCHYAIAILADFLHTFICIINCFKVYETLSMSIWKDKDIFIFSFSSDTPHFVITVTWYFKKKMVIIL